MNPRSSTARHNTSNLHPNHHEQHKQQGKPGSSFHIITSGTCRVTIHDPNAPGQRREVTKLHQDDFFGEFRVRVGGIPGLGVEEEEEEERNSNERILEGGHRQREALLRWDGVVKHRYLRSRCYVFMAWSCFPKIFRQAAPSHTAAHVRCDARRIALAD